MENPLLCTTFPHIQPKMATVQRRVSHRWSNEVNQLVQRRSTFKHSVPEVKIRRDESRKWSITDVANRKPALTRHMSHMSTRHTSITLVERAREAVISTKLRRQKSDLEQEVKLQQAKRRRFVLEKRDSVHHDEATSSHETINVEV